MGQMDAKMYRRVLERKATQEGVSPESIEGELRAALKMQGILPPSGAPEEACALAATTTPSEQKE